MSEDFKEVLEKIESEEGEVCDIGICKYFWEEAINKCERIMEDSCIHGFFPIIHAMKSLK